jgi:hypothetical protein
LPIFFPIISHTHTSSRVTYFANDRFRPFRHHCGASLSFFAVLLEFASTGSFEDTLVLVINLAGDADTNGAIYGMFAGAYYGYDAIPPHWLNALHHPDMIESVYLPFIENNDKIIYLLFYHSTNRIMTRVLTIILILVALLIAYRYYSNIEGFTTDLKLLNITARIDTNDGYFDIVANTTNNTTIRGVKILYSSVTPVLAPGQSTDSSLALNLVISATPFLILNKPVYTLKNNHKYYFVKSDAVKYTEGVTPLLGSFVFNGPVTPPPILPPIINEPVAPPPILPPVINGPVTPPPVTPPIVNEPVTPPPTQPPVNPPSSVSTTNANLLQEIRSVIRAQLLSDMPSLGQTPTCPTCSQCNNTCTC